MKRRFLNTVSRYTPIVFFNLLSVFLLAHPAEAQQIGYVLDMAGDWFLNGNIRLHEASKLPAGGVIRTPSPSDRSSYIAVVDRSGKIIGKKECRNQGECDTPIQLPNVERPGLIRTIFGAVWDVKLVNNVALSAK